jgi:uncharacterized glyoxalase superfamily protein PhnB
MITSAVPVIATSSATIAEDYYCRVLGFLKMFAHRPNATRSDPCYLGIARDGVWLHLDSFKPERAGSTGAFLWVTDVDAMYEEAILKGAISQLQPTDQTWGTREAHLRDHDGNVICFATRAPAVAA